MSRRKPFQPTEGSIFNGKRRKTGHNTYEEIPFFSSGKKSESTTDSSIENIQDLVKNLTIIEEKKEQSAFFFPKPSEGFTFKKLFKEESKNLLDKKQKKYVFKGNKNKNNTSFSSNGSNSSTGSIVYPLSTEMFENCNKFKVNSKKPNIRNLSSLSKAFGQDISETIPIKEEQEEILFDDEHTPTFCENKIRDTSPIIEKKFLGDLSILPESKVDQASKLLQDLNPNLNKMRTFIPGKVAFVQKQQALAGQKCPSKQEPKNTMFKGSSQTSFFKK